MSIASPEHIAAARWEEDCEIWRCPKCQGSLHHEPSLPALECGACGARLPIDHDLLIVNDRPTENNQVAQHFYDSPLWPKFRFWEHFTWLCNGGERRARSQVLRHLPTAARLKLLDVAIGDGVYLDWLPADWRIVGIDISRSQLDACRARAAGRDVRLVQSEAEELPVESRQFDAVLSIGAFNYFNDPERALREMVRAARPGAPIVVSDEVPNLTDRMLGHKIGLPGIDNWVVSKIMHLGDSFTEMVERHRTLDVRAIAERVLGDVRYESIWYGVGYVFVGRAPG